MFSTAQQLPIRTTSLPRKDDVQGFTRPEPLSAFATRGLTPQSYNTNELRKQIERDKRWL